jgi:mono/diheme cytochrome c family protein
VVTVTLALLTACKSQPSDLREWRASDHSQEEGQGQGAGTAPVPSEDDDNDPMIAALGIWQAQCSTCHGPEGRGDGPQAALTHPTDLTTAAFQSSHTDEQIAASITHGRNMMPGFGSTLRPEGIDVLVRFVRQLGRAGAR